MFSKIVFLTALILPLVVPGATTKAQSTENAGSLIIHADQPGPVISRDLFGQFAEHLGEGIYGGVWVGKESRIPNVRGIRTDVVQALRAIKVPNVRWPGGCFADGYHWRNGIGPAELRVKTINGNWGNVLEPNNFGTDEFMDFVDQIGSEAYITVNVGTGTPQEAADWLEYMTTDQPTTLGKERMANGHKAPYRVKYLGIGNESWGCGGAMSAEAYVERMKLYSLFVHNLNPIQESPIRWVRGPNAMQRIAVGPEDDKTEYTDAVMKASLGGSPWRWGIEGLSLHKYVMGSTPLNSPATGFGEKEYAIFVKQTLDMDTQIVTNAAIMDKYDPKKKIALVVDEWGVWLRPLPNTNPQFLKQQNSLRDAIMASLNLNIFARHADRVRMANIAQMVNVLQSMILTDDAKIVLTPTYYIYKMYVPFQDAQFIPINIESGDYRFNGLTVNRVDAIAARASDGKIWVALTNLDPNNDSDITTSVPGVSVRTAIGEVLTAPRVDAINTFDNPNAVSPKPFTAQATDGKLVIHLPAKSVTIIRLDQ